MSSTMPTVTASKVSAEELQSFDALKESLPDGAIKDAIDVFSAGIHRGENVVIAEETQICTPSQAAAFLGLSRTHLYKILDAGALAFHIVGERDKRILLGDLIAYRDEARGARARTAKMFAAGTSAEDAMLDETP
jgi:excisionase family DNA binding protein